MAITLYNIKKWTKMFMGRSILHVNQNLGKTFSSTELKGYYNDLTEKVTRLPELLISTSLPKMKIPNGKEITFSVDVFQYGLGAYDLYLLTNEQKYFKKFWQAVDWTIQHQVENGAWDTFGWVYPEAPYGAMAQGEAVSLLMRAYKESKNEVYMQAATKAIKFMLMPTANGGCSQYDGNSMVLLEFTNRAAVLNGWIFAWWGLYDYALITKNQYVEQMLKSSLVSLINYLPLYQNSYWSMYDLSGNIASPFYHNLHIAQMEAMYFLTKEQIFIDFSTLWKKQQSNLINKLCAIFLKGWQKIKE